MYSRQHRTSKSNSNNSDTPATNQFAPRPFVIQPQTEEVKPPQNQTADLQAKGEKLEQVGYGFPDAAVFTRHTAPPRVPRVQMKLNIGKAGDKYEQEADKMAANVVQQSGGQIIQRGCFPSKNGQERPEATYEGLLNGTFNAADYIMSTCYFTVGYTLYKQGVITKDQLEALTVDTWPDVFNVRNGTLWGGGPIPRGKAIGFRRVGETRFLHAAISTGEGTMIRGTNSLHLGLGWLHPVDLSTVLGAPIAQGTYQCDGAPTEVFISN